MPIDVRRLLADSLTNPRAAAGRVLNSGIGMADAAGALVALSCFSTILTYLTSLMLRYPVDPVTAAITAVPLLGAVLQAAASFVFAGLTYFVGALAGGRGNLTGALIIVAWLSTVTAVLQVAQITFLLVFPPLSGALSVASLIWVFWAFSNGAAELHGFSSVAKVFAVTLLCMFIAGALIAFTVTMFGIGIFNTPGV